MSVCVCSIDGVGADAGANNQSINGRIFFNFSFPYAKCFISFEANVLNANHGELCACVCVRDAVRLIHDQNESKCFANS